MANPLIPLLALAVWASGHLLVNPRPNAGTPAPTANASRPRRYRGRHAANRRKRANA